MFEFKSNLEKITDYVKSDKYKAAVTSAWAFYIPSMGAIELGVGLTLKYFGNSEKSIDDILITTGLNRIMAAGMHAVALEPMRRLRKYWSNKYNITQDSPRIDKVKVAVASMTTMQLPTYSAVLGATSLIRGSHNWDEFFMKLGLVLGAGILTATHYNKFADLWGHKFFNQPSLLYHADEKMPLIDLIKNTFRKDARRA